MKTILTAVAIVSIFCFAHCKKNKPDSNGLPAATQEGKNTLGFLLNGKPWKPQGSRVTSNLSIDFDPNFNKGVFNIVAYNFNTPISEQFIIGISDSLNFVITPANFNLSNRSLLGAAFSDSVCTLFSNDAGVTAVGNLNITKLDRVNHIIAGTFNMTLSKIGCNMIKITDGRFDEILII